MAHHSQSSCGNDGRKLEGISGDCNSSFRARAPRPLSRSTSTPPGEDCRNLFVGDISKFCTDEDLRQLFSQWGKVVDVRLKYAKITKHPLGYGFVEMASYDAALLCRQNLSGAILHGKPIYVGWASRNTKLFVGNLPHTITEALLRDTFSPYGAIESVHINYSNNGSIYGVVGFDHREDAELARASVDGTKILSNTVHVNWEQSPVNRPNVQNTVHNFFSVHVSFRCAEVGKTITEKALFNVFRRYGSITTVCVKSLFVDNKTNLTSGFGFIHYDNIDAAHHAVHYGADIYVDGVNYTAEFSKHMKRRGDDRLSPSPITTLSPVQYAFSPIQHMQPDGVMRYSPQQQQYYFTPIPYNMPHQMPSQVYTVPPYVGSHIDSSAYSGESEQYYRRWSPSYQLHSPVANNPASSFMRNA